jgi:hypothetical protein
VEQGEKKKPAHPISRTTAWQKQRRARRGSNILASWRLGGAGRAGPNTKTHQNTPKKFIYERKTKD